LGEALLGHFGAPDVLKCTQKGTTINLITCSDKMMSLLQINIQKMYAILGEIIGKNMYNFVPDI
jgi:hypothetical protein